MEDPGAHNTQATLNRSEKVGTPILVSRLCLPRTADSGAPRGAAGMGNAQVGLAVGGPECVGVPWHGGGGGTGDLMSGFRVVEYSYGN